MTSRDKDRFKRMYAFAKDASSIAEGITLERLTSESVIANFATTASDGKMEPVVSQPSSRLSTLRRAQTLLYCL